MIDSPDDEGSRYAHWNFDECSQCKNKFKPRICAGCGAGEEFELDDPQGVDEIFGD